MDLWGRIRSAVDAFANFNLLDDDATRRSNNYALLLAFYSGTWIEDGRVSITRSNSSSLQRRLYKATVQDWRHADAVVSLYEQFVYTGDLPRDPEDVLDPDRCAIPIDPHTGKDASDEAIANVLVELWPAWNYQSQMSQRPKFGAILGDGLIELTADFKRAWVYPEWVEPWVVTDLELDRVGNVKAYTTEWDVDIPEAVKYGQKVDAEHYHFKKECNGEGTWYWKDDDPHPDYGTPGDPGFERNLYGFVSALWDRHEEQPGSDRGVAAIQRTIGQAMRLNSVLSAAHDYQQKKFAAPVGIIGGPADSQWDAVREKLLGAPTLTEQQRIDAAIRRAMEKLRLMPMGPDGKFVTVDFDLGGTNDLIGILRDSIYAEAPEAKYGQQILEMSQVTAPGIERALAPIVGRVNRARDQYDPQTIKKFQMAIAQIGFHLKNGDFPAEIVAARKSRYDPFKDFGLESYGQGLLDFSIKKRPVFSRSDEERVALAILMETLTTEPGMKRGGFTDEEITELVKKQEADQEAESARLSGFAAQQQEEQPGGETPNRPGNQAATQRQAVEPGGRQ